MSSTVASVNYRPDIDGLRAVAVLSVVLYHAHLAFPGGYVGVDIFFVISGYLITGLLLKSIRQGSFSYLDFWERRVRRLVPALAVVTVVTGCAGYFLLLPDDLVDLGGALISQPLLLSNVYFWRVVKGGYFGDLPESRPMLHTWSLGVEEQFYVFFPVLLVAIHQNRVLTRHTGRLLALVTLVSLVLGIFLTPIRPALSFFTLPTRAWELLGGGLLHFGLRLVAPGRANLRHKFIREVCAWVGVGLIAYSLLTFHTETPFPGTAALVPCLGAILLIFSNSQGKLTGPGKALAHPMMVQAGRISYSLYLWHWPILAFGEYFGWLSSTESKIFAVILSGWMGYFSWRWIETPFREKRWLAGRKAVFTFFVAYACICIVMGYTYRIAMGFPQNWGKVEPGNLRSRKDLRTRIRELDSFSPPPKLDFLGAGPSETGHFLLWGDSHAMSLAPLLHELGREYGVKGLQLTKTASPPLLTWEYSIVYPKKTDEFKLQWAKLATKTVGEYRPKIVFLVCNWTAYGTPKFREDLEGTVEALGAHQARVVFVGDVPLQPAPSHRVSQLATRWPLLLPSPADAKSHRARNHIIYDAIQEVDPAHRLEVIDLAPTILSWPSLSSNDRPLYVDRHHLSDYGALELRPLFEPHFRQMKE